MFSLPGSMAKVITKIMHAFDVTQYKVFADDGLEHGYPFARLGEINFNWNEPIT